MFAWRPRPVSILTAEQKRHIYKNLTQYRKKFEKEDQVKQQIVLEEFVRKRNKNLQEFGAHFKQHKDVVTKRIINAQVRYPWIIENLNAAVIQNLHPEYINFHIANSMLSF